MIPNKTEGAASRSLAPTSERRRRPVYRPAPDGLVVWDEPGGKWSRPPAFPDAAARLVSSAEDLLACARMLLRGVAESEAERHREAGGLPSGEQLLGIDSFAVVEP